MTITRATLADVATLAKVSGKTVSRVVNHEPNVSAVTKERVERAIAELDFSPNQSARSLAAARSYLIGAISPRISAHYVNEVHRGAAEACRSQGFHLTLEVVDANEDVKFEVFARTLRKIGFDGVILMPPLTDFGPLLDLLDEQGVRYVRLSPLTDPDRSDAVYADEAEGVDMLVGLLWDLGHRRFGIIEGPPNHLATRLRRDGVLQAVQRRGGDRNCITIDRVPQLHTKKNMFHVPADVAINVGFKAASRILCQQNPPTAILAFNDDIAAGVIGYGHHASLTIPEDLSVVGFDDAITSLVTWPALTTVRQPIAQMAKTAVDWLASPAVSKPRSVTLPVELILRSSSDKCRPTND